MNEAIVVTLTPEQDHFDDLLQMLGTLMPGTRSFEGCEMAQVFHCKDKNEVVLLQVWQSSAAHDSYLDWRATNGHFDQVADLLAKEQIHKSYHLL